MGEVGVRPEWASWFHTLGTLAVHHQFVDIGGDSPRIVVSSPTGQFVAWMIAAGALDVEPDEDWSDPIEEGPTFTSWISGKKRMGDTRFKRVPSGSNFSYDPTFGLTQVPDSYPARLLPDGTPSERGGAPPKQNVRDRVRAIPGLKLSVHTWWARHCISPVVIIGDGRSYLQGQRQELLEKAPHWFSDKVQVLLSEESGQTENSDRMYFHPFMLLSPRTGDSKPWLRATRPRLVIVTSWSSYTRRHASLFAGAPHVIITNRRVPSAVEAASTLEFDHTAKEWSDGMPPPPGVNVRVLLQRVTIDSGELSDDDESEWQL